MTRNLVRSILPKLVVSATSAASRPVGLLVYCSDYHCSHWTTISADRWSDDVRLSDLEPLFVCQACGTRPAELRPDFEWNKPQRGNVQRPHSMARDATEQALK